MKVSVGGEHHRSKIRYRAPAIDPRPKKRWFAPGSQCVLPQTDNK